MKILPKQLIIAAILVSVFMMALPKVSKACCWVAYPEFSASPTAVCLGGTVVFTDQSYWTPTSWSWSFPGGTPATSTAQNPSVVYSTTGTYDVTLTVANGCGTSAPVTKSAYIIVDGPPVAAFTGSPTTVCVGSSVVFTDQSQSCPTSWSWAFEGGTPATSTAQNPSIAYNTVGTYSVTLTSTNANGSSAPLTKTAYITVVDIPVAAFTGTPLSFVCAGGTVTFTDESIGCPTSWSWTFPGGTPATSTAQNPSVVYSSTGSFDVTLTATNGYGSSAPLTKTSYINVVPPVAAFSGSQTSFCPGGTVAFTDQSTGCPTSWSWTFPGGTPASSTAQNPSVVYSVAGSYDVTLTATNSAGSSAPLTETSYITAFGPPSVNLGLDVTLRCTSSQLDAGNATATYLWSTGATTSTIIPSATGNYSVTVSRCSSTTTDDVNVTIDNTGCPLPPPAIAGGVYHSLAICNGGTVRSWGLDGNGQLGNDAALTDQPTAVAVASLTNIVSIAGVGWHSIALKSDGTVWSWGYDYDYGQLGDDAALADQPTPVQMSGLTNITAIAGGKWHSLALKNDGTIWSCGWDLNGQLGDDVAFTDQYTPVLVATSGVIATAIAAGARHSIALRDDGTVWSWGWDNLGQLGDDAGLVSQATPVQVSSLSGVIAVAAGGRFSLALKNDGTVWAWGEDAQGALGNDAALANQSTPVEVASLTGVIAIAGGFQHALALKSDGTVWAWGLDGNGQLGNDAALVNQATPVQVASLTNIIAIAAGSYHSLALKNDSTVWSWGLDTYGQLGDDAALANKPTPVQVSGLCAVAPLPIDLLSFSAICLSSNMAEIKWSTASETNNDFFTIERSLDAVNWKVVGKVEGANNSRTTKNYSFIDQLEIRNTEIFYYRLKQTDFDGKHEYFNLTSCTCKESTDGINILSVYPNSESTTVTINVSSSENTEGTISITDVLGRTILQKKSTIQEGFNQFSLDISSLSKAFYLVQINTNTRLYQDQKQFCIK